MFFIWDDGYKREELIVHKIKVEVINETGLHARPASVFLKEALKYKSDITVIKDSKEYNGKSIINILRMGASKGDMLTLSILGEDEEKAAKVLKEMFANGFGE